MLDALLPMAVRLKGVVGVGGSVSRLSIGTWVMVVFVLSLLSHILCLSSAVVRAVRPFDCRIWMYAGRWRGRALGEGEERGKLVFVKPEDIGEATRLLALSA